MPYFALPPKEYFVHADALLLDSGVLVAAFDPTDNHHLDAHVLLEEMDFDLYVSAPVVVEAFAVLRRRAGFAAAREMLDWLNTPGTVRELLPENCARLGEASGLVSGYSLDVVDTLLLTLSDSVWSGAQLASPLKIATFDIRDFVPLLGQIPMRFRIYNIHNNETLSL